MKNLLRDDGEAGRIGMGSLSTHEWIVAMSMKARLALSFRGETVDDWRGWRGRWLSKLEELMGPLPDRAPLNPVTIQRVEMDGYVREKIIFRTDGGSSVPAYVLSPRNGRCSRLPAILCAHGHDGHNSAKEAVAGVEGAPGARETIEAFNSDYARQLALRGYVTMAPDWRAFGERYDRSGIEGRDPCNVVQNSLSWLGYSLLSLDVFDARAALDYLQSRRDVDPDRLGMVGLSYGGRVTTFTAALDERVRVAVVSGALNLFAERIRARGSCGSQVVRGLLEWGDVPEVLGLVAPRPLLVERGRRDALLPEDSFRDGFSRLQAIYRAAGVSERLAKDEFDGGHRFHGVDALEWFDRWL
jgi:dienelactone hydrolase